MQPNERIIRDFLDAWSRLDADELCAYFTDDVVYHNMPGPPVEGREAVERRIRAFLSGWTETTWEVLTLLADGDVVIAERVDRTVAGTKRVDLPCVGIFLLRDGKIAVWRDYFDLATYQRAMA
ncbi:MAG: limonene-1,2-epoxide hydrolase family protein [Dehalococcoidia bacterium]